MKRLKKIIMKLRKPLTDLRSILGGCVVGLARGSAQTILHPSEQHFWPTLHSLSTLHSFGWSGHDEGLGNTGHTTDPIRGRTPWRWTASHLVWESFTYESVSEMQSVSWWVRETVNQLSHTQCFISKITYKYALIEKKETQRLALYQGSPKEKI